MSSLTLIALIPLLSSALNLGVAIGGYVTTLPFADERFPASAIAVWFEVFFLPGFVLAVTLGFVSLVAGVRLYRRSPNAAMIRFTLVGLVFTVVHFCFGNSVLGYMARILNNPPDAREEILGWLKLHATRTLVADLPAFAGFLACFLNTLD
ncbi:hypothetical protein N7510_000107 [Penicillium lagena]|uniref:uncharacterized protein n=1 Tax=Penicillium lagena TaxID=94218 RepID=UPI0025402129|nr:uncharacterized protein N7510_000107 [Penicillium lagena]KAJ5623798.1 hypothetical protein N7510_000107 [Penicillium lagena]